MARDAHILRASMPYIAYIFSVLRCPHLCDLLKMSAKKPSACYKEYTHKAHIIVSDNVHSVFY